MINSPKKPHPPLHSVTAAQLCSVFSLFWAIVPQLSLSQLFHWYARLCSQQSTYKHTQYHNNSQNFATTFWSMTLWEQIQTNLNYFSNIHSANVVTVVVIHQQWLKRSMIQFRGKLRRLIKLSDHENIHWNIKFLGRTDPMWYCRATTDNQLGFCWLTPTVGLMQVNMTPYVSASCLMSTIRCKLRVTGHKIRWGETDPS